jgi:hypothetical protein
MQGIELSQGFYADIVRPWLAEVAPGLPYAAALIGYGSELLGFDDEMSKDHNWGPRLHVFMAREHFDLHARRLVSAFSKAMPPSYLGEPIGWRNRPHPPASGEEAVGAIEHGLEVHTLEATLERLLAVRSVSNLTPLHWLGFAEQRLLAFTGGAVFHDGDGRLSMARGHLAYFPRDVWLYKIACQWRRIAEEQAFVGRAGQVGDDLGSRIITARLARDVMRMAFLLERQYAPYAKWFGSAFARLPSRKPFPLFSSGRYLRAVGKSASKRWPRPTSIWVASNKRSASHHRLSRSSAPTTADHSRPSTPRMRSPLSKRPSRIHFSVRSP